MLKLGIVRRIGNGQTTEVWAHNWIPRSGMMRLVSPLIPNPPHLVSELINVYEATWNEQLVRSVFLPVYAEAILSIPLYTRNIEDFWAWS